MKWLPLLPPALGIFVAATIPILSYGLDLVAVLILCVIGGLCVARFADSSGDDEE